MSIQSAPEQQKLLTPIQSLLQTAELDQLTESIELMHSAFVRYEVTGEYSHPLRVQVYDCREQLLLFFQALQK